MSGAVAAHRRLFGTDGIRARSGEPPLDRSTVTALARELAAVLRERHAAASHADPAARTSAPPQVVLGGDTRESTAEICGWLADGLAAGGVMVRYAGVIPTPGISFLAAEIGAAAGVAVSASHNPYPDNGIKLLDAQGFKWSEAAEADLEARLDGAAAASARPSGPLVAEGALRERYLDHLQATVTELLPVTAGAPPLAGMRVVLDAGNGAASAYAGELFERLGAGVTLLCAVPDGRNVNLGCGSTAR